MRSILISIILGLIITSASMAQSVWLDHVDGIHTGNDNILADNSTPIVFSIRVIGDANTHGGMSTGFRIYSPDGATWNTTTHDTLGTLGKAQFDGLFFLTSYSITGSGADTVSYGAARFIGSGLPVGFDDVAFSITIGPIPTSNHNKTICLDSSYFPPSGVWIWQGPDVFPAWDGPHCFTCIDPIALDVEDISSGELPENYFLSHNYPNPFNPETNIKFTLPRTSHVKLELYNILGVKVKTLVNEKLSAGENIISWDGTDNNNKRVTSGIYLYRLSTDNFTETKKMLLLK